MVEAQQTLREFVAPGLFFANFPSLSDFDDTYTCDICVDTHLCLVCTEIEDALKGDISYDISYEVLLTKLMLQM